MFLATELPCLTQHGSRELSAYKVHRMRQSSKQRFEEVSAFLKNELQELHDYIASPDGLLLEDDLSHSGNRHAEVHLRQLGMGLRQSMAMCCNLAEQMGTDLYQASCEANGMRAANGAVLAQLTLITGKVEGRVEELSRRRRR
jgi:hypothetical protein